MDYQQFYGKSLPLSRPIPGFEGFADLFDPPLLFLRAVGSTHIACHPVLKLGAELRKELPAPGSGLNPAEQRHGHAKALHPVMDPAQWQ